MANILDTLRYTEEHEWILDEGDSGSIGITDFAQKSLGDIVFVELPEIGKEFEKGESFGVVESIKSVNDLLMPVSGEVLAINEELADRPELCNQDPYGAWMIKVKFSNKEEVGELLTPDQYSTQCENS